MGNNSGHMSRFTTDFFLQDPVSVARGLVGSMLWRQLPTGQKVGNRIVETEAYWGEQDLACHARFGRTKRSEPLYGPPGRAYIYLIYGMYWLLNVVTEIEGQPSAVLIRALEPTTETSLVSDSGCLSGPGKLTRALQIDQALSGCDMTHGTELWLEPARMPQQVIATPRIGVEYAGQWAKKPWRFADPVSICLSRPI